MTSALTNGVKGGKWFSLIDKAIRLSTLEIAWRKVAANHGAAGVDGESVKRFAARSEDYLRELSESLSARTYRPSPVKRVEIPKGDGKTRPLGIPTVKDRIVQTAVKLAIEPIFEAEFREGSYGFRPGRGAKDALREVDRLVGAGYVHVVDADLKSYFDTIPHDRLMARVKEKISDGAILALIEGFLGQDIMTEMATWRPTAGTPQGAALIAALGQRRPAPARPSDGGARPQDGALRRRLRHPVPDGSRGGRGARRGRSVGRGKRPRPQPEEDAHRRLPTMGPGIRVPRLPVRGGSPVCARQEPEGIPGQGEGEDDTHARRRAGADRKPTSIRCCAAGSNISSTPPRRSSAPSTASSAAACAPSSRKQEKRPGFGRCAADQQQWPNAFFASLGLFTLETAREQARRSR